MHRRYLLESIEDGGGHEEHCHDEYRQHDDHMQDAHAQLGVRAPEHAREDAEEARREDHEALDEGREEDERQRDADHRVEDAEQLAALRQRRDVTIT